MFANACPIEPWLSDKVIFLKHIGTLFNGSTGLLFQELVFGAISHCGFPKKVVYIGFRGSQGQVSPGICVSGVDSKRL